MRSKHPELTLLAYAALKAIRKSEAEKREAPTHSGARAGQLPQEAEAH